MSGSAIQQVHPDWTNDIHQGDVLAVLEEMPESSVHMAMTSPPYFGLRDYGEEVDTVWGGDDDCTHSWITETKAAQGGQNTEDNPPGVGGNEHTQETRLRGSDGIDSLRCTECGAWQGQLGLEPRLDQFVDNLVEVGRALQRVLRDDGSWWLNLGDSFAGSWGGQGYDGETKNQPNAHPDKNPARNASLPEKCKMLVPHRVAIALIDAGWILRNDAVWKKPNPMPHPVKDRLNDTFEFVFHFVQEQQYWYDLDAVREPHADSSLDRDEYGYNSAGVGMLSCPREDREEEVIVDDDQALHPKGKNPGDVFEIPTRSFPDAHFAVFPPDLCETPLKATCPEQVCANCGTPYDRETETKYINPGNRQTNGPKYVDRGDESPNFDQRLEAVHIPGELEPACECDTDETEPGIALDPFAGAGTLPMVAKEMGRRFIGIELNPEYVAMAQKRVGVTVDEPERLLEDGETALTAYGGASSDD